MDALLEIVRKYWGFESLRPLQAEAMQAALAHRDSLVVLPTGGGKSLCYQAPALLSDQLTVVVSPLIALMKDQVDRLIARGVKAAFLNSSLDAEDRRRVARALAAREYRLLFVAPERFASSAFVDHLAMNNVGAFAIDEAHCISHWGHDFRADYRRLDLLKKRFPQASVHAFTATATPRVREDIIEQLGLTDPCVLVGDFFRPNLHYSAYKRSGEFDDIVRAVRERIGKPGIVYCIRRRDVEELTERLRHAGVRAVGYHAGMSDEARTRAQDAFSSGEADVVVATIAFGMGIDRSDIRFVIHAAMPKSIEHYQQETGRAGRDGQSAECILFYSGSDFHTWQHIINEGESETAESLRLLAEMYNFCTSSTCRHRRLVTYFGQTWTRDRCGACDVCTGRLPVLADSTVIAQKILSGVVRTGERYGAVYVATVLIGELTEQVEQRGHDILSTFGLLSQYDRREVLGWIDQLVDLGCLRRDGEYRVLKVTPFGWGVLRSQEEVTLVDAAQAATRSRSRARTSRPAAGTSRLRAEMKRVENQHAPAPLKDDQRELFERLREVRKALADEAEVPAFVVFSDATLRELARVRPSNRAEFLRIKGAGPAKWELYGHEVLRVISEFGST